MNVWTTVAPAIEPLDPKSVKRQLHVDDDSEDEWIAERIQAAREWAEDFTGRKLIQQTLALKLDAFPSCGVIVLPHPPVLSVTSVQYVDTAGATQTWSSSLYLVDRPTGPKAQPARIVPAYGESWPSTRRQLNAVTVTYVAGYGDAIEHVPAAFLQAMQARIATWHMQRAGLVVGTSAQPVPQADELVLWPFKVWL